MTRFEGRGSRYEVRLTRYEVRRTRSKGRGAQHTVYNGSLVGFVCVCVCVGATPVPKTLGRLYCWQRRMTFQFVRFFLSIFSVGTVFSIWRKLLQLVVSLSKDDAPGQNVLQLVVSLNSSLICGVLLWTSRSRVGLPTLRSHKVHGHGQKYTHSRLFKW